jgi:hypothetical protein
VLKIILFYHICAFIKGGENCAFWDPI